MRVVSWVVKSFFALRYFVFSRYAASIADPVSYVVDIARLRALCLAVLFQQRICSAAEVCCVRTSKLSLTVLGELDFNVVDNFCPFNGPVSTIVTEE
jgi:hypothetical protein